MGILAISFADRELNCDMLAKMKAYLTRCWNTLRTFMRMLHPSV